MEKPDFTHSIVRSSTHFFLNFSIIAYSLIISRIRYALPSWTGFVSVDLIHRIDALLRRLKRYGYTEDLLSFSELSRCANLTLFNKVCVPGHCLYHLTSAC